MASKPKRDYAQDIASNPRLPEHDTQERYAEFLSSIFPEVSARTYRRHISGLCSMQLKDPPQPKETTNKNEWDVSKQSAIWSYNGTAVVHTLEDALSYSNVDLNIWEVERHTWNQWEVTMKDDKKQPLGE